ncbi:MAG: hypothetical protein LBJ71_03360, partial [Holosporaceae bacterium]|nr:hypothetical protein [Holosporaceae bacterium]
MKKIVHCLCICYAAQLFTVDGIEPPSEEMLKKMNGLMINEDENGINEIGECLLKIAEAVNSGNIELTHQQFDLYFSTCKRLALLANKGNPTAIWRMLLINHGRSLENELQEREIDLVHQIRDETINVKDLTVNSDGEITCVNSKGKGENISKRNGGIDKGYDEGLRALDELYSSIAPEMFTTEVDEDAENKAEKLAVKAFKDPNSQEIRVTYPTGERKPESVVLDGFIRKDFLGKSGFHLVYGESYESYTYKASDAQNGAFWSCFFPQQNERGEGGWKIHVSVTPNAGAQLLILIRGILKACDLTYKVSESARAIRGLSLSALFGGLSSQIGKTLVIYPKDDFEAAYLVALLDRVISFGVFKGYLRLADFFTCTGDFQVGRSGAVSVRYCRDYSDPKEDNMNRLSPEITSPVFAEGYEHPFSKLGMKHLGISLPDRVG